MIELLLVLITIVLFAVFLILASKTDAVIKQSAAINAENQQLILEILQKLVNE